MRRQVRSWLANWLLTERERGRINRQGFGQPFFRDWFRREFWEPATRELFGLYPPGHPYYQGNPILRFYPLCMTLLLVAAVAGRAIARILRWVVR